MLNSTGQAPANFTGFHHQHGYGTDLTSDRDSKPCVAVIDDISCIGNITRDMHQKNFTGVKRNFWLTKFLTSLHVRNRDDHYLVCRLDIREDSEFATRYGYPKTAFEQKPGTDQDIRNAFIKISRIQTFGKFAHCTIIHLLLSEASFQPSVPWLRVCLWCNLCTVECSLISFPS